jgi:type II secretory pathway pseudopilin PulG
MAKLTDHPTALRRGSGSTPRRGGPLRSTSARKRPRRRRGFLLVLVLIVLAIASLAALNFSDSMLVAHEAARLDSQRLQARMMAESGLQSVRLFVSNPRGLREEAGGTWSNPQKFQALNIIPSPDLNKRGNVTIVAPSLDQAGNFDGFRFGLENESAKLNLNTLVAIDKMAKSLGAVASAGSSAMGGALGGALGGENGMGEMSENFGRNQLMKLPGMTEEIADAILDWLDEDDEPRPYGAEFSDTYMQMQPPYKPANGPIDSIEQLLLVRGVTPQLLFGYDQNRNGYIDAGEQSQLAMGAPPGGMPGEVSIPALTASGQAAIPGPLGLAPYLTLHSQEKNVALDGSRRININSDDLQTLYQDLQDALGNDLLASFIIAYRIAGRPPAGAGSPLQTLLAGAGISAPDGMMGAQLSAMAQQANQPGQGGSQQPPQLWSPAALDALDWANQQGSVRFNQVLDIVDATVVVPGQNNQPETVYLSPVAGQPVSLALFMPQVMDKLTTVDARTIPGRINIMECPREILAGIPGLTEEIVDAIIQARADGASSENRQFETWLAVEGIVTIQQMRGLLPLVTCGGDVFKAQVVGYFEGSASFARVEAIINACESVPMIQFYRRLDHLGRGFEIPALGQRFDIGDMPNVNLR